MQRGCCATAHVVRLSCCAEDNKAQRRRERVDSLSVIMHDLSAVCIDCVDLLQLTSLFYRSQWNKDFGSWQDTDEELATPT